MVREFSKTETILCDRIQEILDEISCRSKVGKDTANCYCQLKAVLAELEKFKFRKNSMWSMRGLKGIS